MIEEGPLKSSTDFRMREADAYRDLYQESAARKTADKAINILQGRCVGGGTTVNWTSSFRTPAATLAHWQSTHGWSRDGAADLAPWFDRVEARLGIAPWPIAPNANNAALARGAANARHPPRRHPPQRQGLLESRLLRDGMPDQREAVDAGHDDPARARCAARRCVTRARANCDTSSAATTSKASNAWQWTQQERRRRHAGSPCARARS